MVTLTAVVAFASCGALAAGLKAPLAKCDLAVSLSEGLAEQTAWDKMKRVGWLIL